MDKPPNWGCPAPGMGRASHRYSPSALNSHIEDTPRTAPPYSTALASGSSSRYADRSSLSPACVGGCAKPFCKDASLVTPQLRPPTLPPHHVSREWLWPSAVLRPASPAAADELQDGHIGFAPVNESKVVSDSKVRLSYFSRLGGL